MKHDGQSDLRDLIQGLFDDPQRRHHLTLQVLREHWADIVGTGLADKTHPARLEGPLLWVWARDSAWVYQLQFFKEDLLRSVQTFLESDEITDLRFRLGKIPERAATPVPAAESAATRAPATGFAPAQDEARAAPRPANPEQSPSPAHEARAAAEPEPDETTVSSEHRGKSGSTLEEEPELPLLVREPGGEQDRGGHAGIDDEPDDPQAAELARRMAHAIPDPLLRLRFMRAYARSRRKRHDDEPPRN